MSNLEENYIPFQCMIMSYSDRFNVEGVSTAQYQILEILYKQGGKTTKELAEIKGISQSGVSKLTKRLLEKKYVEQIRQDNDRRSYKILITEQGEDFLNRVENFGSEIIKLIEESLSDTDIEQFSTMCRKITAQYTKHSTHK